MSEIDGVLKVLGNQPGVIGTIVMKMNGLPIRSTFKDAETVHYAGLVSEFVKKAKSSLETNILQNPINVIRVRSHKNEIIITPDADLILVVVQDANLTL